MNWEAYSFFSYLGFFFGVAVTGFGFGVQVKAFKSTINSSIGS